MWCEYRKAGSGCGESVRWVSRTGERGTFSFLVHSIERLLTTSKVFEHPGIGAMKEGSSTNLHQITTCTAIWSSHSGKRHFSCRKSPGTMRGLQLQLKNWRVRCPSLIFANKIFNSQSISFLPLGWVLFPLKFPARILTSGVRDASRLAVVHLDCPRPPEKKA